MKFKAMFQPIEIGNMTVKNRFVVPPMGNNFANTDGTMSEQSVAYYAARAKGGFGLVTIEATVVHPDAKGGPRKPCLYDNSTIDSFKKIIDACHAEGAKVSIQLQNAGPEGNAKNAGAPIKAATSIKAQCGRDIPETLTTEEIYVLVDGYGDAAERALKAGADAVEVHMAHGYLVNSFMSPRTNKRVDEFGGCFENRMRFSRLIIEKIREKVGDGKVLCALSGGVDSSVAAVMLSKAIGKQLTCVFVDHGLLRKNEGDEVEAAFADKDINFIRVNAKAAFMEKLNGVSDPETKRKTIGEEFIRAFERESKKLGTVDFLAQGTIYPDVIESLSVNGPSQTIKSHHNVGGLPDYMKLKLVEPLRLLFKDEVRRVGKSLGLPDKFLQRHPFPGPGLAIRILGEITPEKVRLLQEADHIFISMPQEEGLYNKVWQAGVMLLPVQSVGVMGDERTYESVVALRAVESTDGMTADWCHLPYEFLARVSNRIINNVRGINRVVYDISSKPPATIEWE